MWPNTRVFDYNPNMVLRRFHYDKAFEYHLRQLQIPHVSVDEARRSLQLGRVHDKLKNFDFVVYPSTGKGLLVDVKGRKHTGKAKHYQNWVTADDIDCMKQWEELFGPEYQACFAFIFWCEKQPGDALFENLFEFDGRWYTSRALTLAQYRQQMKVRSDSWKTVHMPPTLFSQIALPVEQMFV